MAQNKPINIVGTDNTSTIYKQDILQHCGYFKRTRWERETIIDVLNTDQEYIDNTLSDKAYQDSVRDYSAFGHTVESSLYADLDTGNMLYATVAHRHNVSSSQNQQYIDSTGENESFVFASIFPNSTISYQTGRGGNQLAMLPGVQLFRYDPAGKNAHPNNKEIYAIIEEKYGHEAVTFYKYFFTEEVPFPHFHFSNRTMATACQGTSKANAISLDKLIEYVSYLMNIDKHQPHVLNAFDFFMPYLAIRDNHIPYRTSVNVQCLQEALATHTANVQIENIFKQTQKIQPGVKILSGLEAVYADLVLLRILRGDHAPEHYEWEHEKTLFALSDGNIRKHSYMSFKQFPNNDGLPRYDISMAECQLASKIASGNTITIKNTKSKDKLHFDKSNPYVDEISLGMLHKLLQMCDKTQYKGDYHGPKN